MRAVRRSGIGNRWRGGSGVVVEQGKVLTNAHNLHGDEIRVFFPDGREADGKVLGADGDGDLAVIGVDTGDAPAIDWGDGGTAGHWRPGGRDRQPRWPGRARHAGLRLRAGPRLPRAARASRGGRGGAHRSPAAAAHPADPIVDGDGRLLGINTNRLGSGFYQAIAATRR